MPSPQVVPQSVQLHPHTRSAGPGSTQTLLLCAILAAAVLALYYPVHGYPFVDVDDYAYVVNNARVLGPLNFATVQWAFTHPFGFNYDPLTFFSHSIDVRMFGLNAGRHHLTNVFLHALDALLLFLVLQRATGFAWRSFMVAALFALHPVNVENVAWIAERKTLLSTVFFLLALEAYRWYASEPKRRRMLVVALLYLLGLLAKPQVITLPFVLLLWDYWPLRRMFADAADASPPAASEALPSRTFFDLVKEKIPLFVIAAIDSVLTVVAQHQTNVQVWPYSLPVRIANAVVAYAQYLGKAVWPANLAMEYLYRGNTLKWWEVSGAAFLLLGITFLVVSCRRHRYLPVGWFWFLGILVPMIGLVTQPDLEALADRYAYTAFIGLFLVVCWGVSEWVEQAHLPRFLLPIASVAVLLILSALTSRQRTYWNGSANLWTHTLAVTHRNWVADFRLGVLYQEQGKQDQALEHFYRAGEDRPRDAIININIALIEHERGNLRQAIQYYEKVLAVPTDEPIKAQVRANLGHIYSKLGDDARAREYYLAAQQPIAAPPPRPAINWHGEWWRDLWPFLRRQYQEWKSGDTSAQEQP